MRIPAPTGQTVHWLIAMLLAVIATTLWLRPEPGIVTPAFGQGQPLAGARGVYAFTGQIDHNRYGLFMLDVDTGTIWCYEIDSVGGARKLRLIAARTWIYDRYLQDFNCAEPGFRMVQELVARQRAQPDPDLDLPARGSDTAPPPDQDTPVDPG